MASFCQGLHENGNPRPHIFRDPLARETVRRAHVLVQLAPRSLLSYPKCFQKDLEALRITSISEPGKLELKLFVYMHPYIVAVI